MLVAARELERQRVADVAVHLDIARETVTRDVDRVVGAETGEHLRSARRAVSAVRAVDVARFLAGADLEILVAIFAAHRDAQRSEEHTSELQSLMRISYAVFCLTKKNNLHNPNVRLN